MTKDPEKMAKVFIALISLITLFAAIGGGMIVSHQHAIEEKSGLWKQEIPLDMEETIPIILSNHITHNVAIAFPFASSPP